MLSTMRSSWFLFALFALFALSSALNIGDMNLDGIEEYLNHGVKRQAQGTGNTPTTTSTSNPPTTTTAPATTSEPPSSTPAASSSQQQDTATSAPATTTAPTTSNGQQSSNKATTSNSVASTTASSSSSKQTATTETTPLVSTSDQIFTTTYVTKSNGQDVTAASTGTSKILTTTGQAVVTKALEGQGNGTSSDGLSSKNKSIIGGVVGGVGGALLLGGIALVCWRIWGRKNRVNEDDADLMAGTGSALGDKSHNSNQSPFQTNLEQYHNGTGGRPNAAANF